MIEFAHQDTTVKDISLVRSANEVFVPITVQKDEMDYVLLTRDHGKSRTNHGSYSTDLSSRR